MSKQYSIGQLRGAWGAGKSASAEEIRQLEEEVSKGDFRARHVIIDALELAGMAQILIKAIGLFENDPTYGEEIRELQKVSKAALEKTGKIYLEAAGRWYGNS